MDGYGGPSCRDTGPAQKSQKKYQKPCVQALGHLCVWFACQEDREQSSSGSEKYVHCPFCVKWQAKADSPQVLYLAIS
jgi:hypothetical protein